MSCRHLCARHRLSFVVVRRLKLKSALKLKPYPLAAQKILEGCTGSIARGHDITTATKPTPAPTIAIQSSNQLSYSICLTGLLSLSRRCHWNKLSTGCNVIHCWSNCIMSNKGWAEAVTCAFASMACISNCHQNKSEKVNRFHDGHLLTSLTQRVRLLV